MQLKIPLNKVIKDQFFESSPTVSFQKIGFGIFSTVVGFIRSSQYKKPKD